MKPDEPLLEFEPDVFLSHFARQPFGLRHRLAGDVLFSMAGLIDLARRLPRKSIEYSAGDVPLTLDPAKAPPTGLSVEETLRRIEHCGAWLVLKNVEQDSAYRALLARCLAEVAPLSQRCAPGMSGEEGFIFVSSPGAVTPYHIDPEENFLLQVRGTKDMYICDPTDRSLLSEEELERFHCGAHRNQRFREACRARARCFRLTPGQGVHVPVTAPHWVRNGAEVSISFSITFRTQASERRARVHRFNAGLRRLGLRPAPAGASALGDGLKDGLQRLMQRTKVM